MLPTEPTIRASIVGGSGYSGAELLRWLIGHPDVEIVGVTSRRHRGQPIETVHRGLPPTGLRFTDEAVEAVARRSDVVFLATPTEASAQLVDELAPLGVRLIDLSGAYRLSDPAAFAAAYGFEHPCSQWLGSFAYGLPELGGSLAAADRVAAPGCFATAIVLSLAPIWRRASEVPARVRVVGVTGSTGSGATPSARTHHPVRATNLAPYRPLRHQHAPEVEHILGHLRSDATHEADAVAVDFVPVSAPLARGICTTTFVDLPEGLAEGSIDAWFAAAYEDHPLVRRLGSDTRVAEVAAVKGSMFVELSWAVSRCGRTLAITAALDNLAKGGAGQAVQCMNVMWERPEARGLGGPALWP